MTVLYERIEEIATLIAEVANGNFDYKIDISETGDELDAIINGINMLGQELKNSTVSRDYLSSVLQGIVDMLLILDTDFNIQTVNNALEEMTGYDEQELKGAHFAQLVHSDDNPMLLPHMEQFKKRGKCLNVEVLLTTKKGLKIPTSCSFSYLLNNKKKANGILIIAKDITKLKQTEQELQEAKNKAEAANQAKSNFLSNMSHEIRTPLNGIMGFTDLLAQTSLTETQKKYLDLIKTSGSSLTRLLHDILDLHRIEQDKISIEAHAFNYKKTISSNLEPYKHMAEGKDLTFADTYEESIPEFVLGDPERITQVLVNLVSNAIKFTEKGSIQIHHKAEYIEDNYIKLTCTVTDTGIGIPSEKQDLIFNHFTQSDESITRKFGGSGLGLTISKKLAELMLGEVGVISPAPNQDNGSVFWFSAVLTPAQQEESTADSSIDPSTFKLPEGTQILVADDNMINTVLIRDVLQGLGAEVTTTENGKEAVETALAGTYDLVFMDLQMPVMNGIEATETLRMSNFKKPVIAFSAAAYKDDINHSLDAGMNDYLCKPFTFEELITLLKKWI